MIHWAQISQWVELPGKVIGLVWLIATGLFLAVLVLLIGWLKRREGVMTSGNRASSTVWSALGWGIFALFASLAVVGYRLGEDAGDIAGGKAAYDAAAAEAAKLESLLQRRDELARAAEPVIAQCRAQYPE